MNIPYDAFWAIALEMGMLVGTKMVTLVTPSFACKTISRKPLTVKQ